MGQTAKAHESGHSGDDLRQGVRALTSDGAIRERPIEDGPFDEFYISPEQRKEYGIQDHEEPYWARDPDFWMKRGENVNRVKQIEGPLHRGGMQGRLIQTPEYDTVHLGGGTEGDLVLMAIPKSSSEMQQKDIDDSRAEYESKLRRTEQGYEGREDTLDRAGLDERMRWESEQNHLSGLIGNGSPTQGMSYPEAVSYYARRGADAQASVAAKQEMLRNGGYHQDLTQESFSDIMAGTRGKTYGMGTTGFPRNPNSAVSQAARKQAGSR